ncbi:MAG TPA: hypothetical protein VD907_03670 [Verrucomicrobiae bacterium]|nr:hypothetical protein [Verrucomicrobiae bacterium]
MKKLIATAIVTIFIGSTAFYLFPQFSTLPDKINLSISLIILTLQLIAIGAFLTSLRAFRRSLRAAYYLLTLGILFFSFNQIQLPVVSFIAIDPIILSLAITLSTLIGAVVSYISMFHLSKLLGTAVSKRDASFTIALASGLAIGAAVAPHTPYPISEPIVDIIFGTYMAAGGFAIGAAILVSRLHHSIAPIYHTAMQWLMASFVAVSFACFHETFIRMVPLFDTEPFIGYILYGFSLWPLFVVACLFFGASLFFRKISNNFSRLPQNTNYMDVITYVSGFISNPGAAEVVLAKTHAIVAGIANPDQLTDSDKVKLTYAYLQLEDYLVTSEPFLNLTRDELRSQLPDSFQDRL